MRKLLLLMLLLISIGAFAQTTTPAVGLVKPDIGDVGWGVTLNSNVDKVDDALKNLGFPRRLFNPRARVGYSSAQPTSLVLDEIGQRLFGQTLYSYGAMPAVTQDGLTQWYGTTTAVGTIAGWTSYPTRRFGQGIYMAQNIEVEVGDAGTYWVGMQKALATNNTGYGHTGSAPSVPGVYFRFAKGVDTSWACVSVNASGNDVVSSGVAVNDDVAITLEILEDPLTQAYHFYIGGQEVCKSGITHWPDRTATNVLIGPVGYVVQTNNQYNCKVGLRSVLTSGN